MDTLYREDQRLPPGTLDHIRLWQRFFNHRVKEIFFTEEKEKSQPTSFPLCSRELHQFFRSFFSVYSVVKSPQTIWVYKKKKIAPQTAKQSLHY